jgi:hypothetical protein
MTRETIVNKNVNYFGVDLKREGNSCFCKRRKNGWRVVLIWNGGMMI